MQLNNRLCNAIEVRTSRRKYINKPLSSSDIENIKLVIKNVNEESGFNFQLIENGEEIFNGFKASYGMLSGVKSFIALVGDIKDNDSKVKAGYYGELIVLECTALGLGTCWIGGTYDKEATKNCVNIGEKEELICVIAVGYVNEEKTLKERFISKLSKNNITINDLVIEKDKDLSKWFETAMEAVLKAPSALNKRPVGYKYVDDKVEAVVTKENHGYEYIDLGISMLHFQLGAKKENIIRDWDINKGRYSFESN